MAVFSGRVQANQGAAAFRRKLFRMIKCIGFSGWVLVLLALPGYAYMDHGGRISRDFAVVDKEGRDDDLIFFTWGGTGGKKERLTLFALCVDGNCTSTNPVIDSALKNGSLFSAAGEIEDEYLGVKDEGDHCDENVCWHSSSGLPADSEIANRCMPGGSRSVNLCRWAVEIPGSRGDIAHAPPVVDAAAERVFVATVDDGGGGSLWAFDLDGNLKGFFRPKRFSDGSGNMPYKKKISSGFYARPAVGSYSYTYNDGASDITEHGTLVFAPGLKNAWLYVLDGRDLQTVIAAFPISEDLQSGGGRVRFEPIVESDLDCVLEKGGNQACEFSVMIGVENGGKKRGLYVYKVPVRVNSDDIGSGGVVFESTNDSELKYAVLNKALPMKLGGELMEHRAGEKFLVATLDSQAGVAVFNLSKAEEGTFPAIYEGDKALPYFAIHPDVRETHRTRPTKAYESVNCGDTSSGSPPICSCASSDVTGCDPVVYVGQKEGAPGGGGQVWKFRMKEQVAWSEDASLAQGDYTEAQIEQYFDTQWRGVFDDHWRGNANQYTWPACLSDSTPSIPTTSWSSPVVHPEGRSVFVSSRNGSGAGGIYQITQPQIISNDPDDWGACPDIKEDYDDDAHTAPTADGLPDYLLDFYPREGWRTTGVFTEDDELGQSNTNRFWLHYGSSHDKIYTLAPDEEVVPGSDVCSRVKWCYDIGDQAKSGLCEAVSKAPCCHCTQP